MADEHITIQEARGTWSVRAGGAILGESSAALELSEKGHAPVIYFPREDIEMAFLDPTDHRTTCPHKGEATHYAIVAKSGAIKNAAWSYEDPKEDVARIKGHIAFYVGERVTVERI